MPPERCDECGFDGDAWTDAAAVEAIGDLPDRWRQAVAGLDADALRRRSVPTMWSIAEYVDHVREVLFGMRFVLDSAVAQPGVDLGTPPEPAFTPTARDIEVAAALDGLGREATELQRALATLPQKAWSATAVVNGEHLDAHWICRHAVHDATHHLQDVHRLRGA